MYTCAHKHTQAYMLILLEGSTQILKISVKQDYNSWCEMEKKKKLGAVKGKQQGNPGFLSC